MQILMYTVSPRDVENDTRPRQCKTYMSFFCDEVQMTQTSVRVNFQWNHELAVATELQCKKITVPSYSHYFDSSHLLRLSIHNDAT